MNVPRQRGVAVVVAMLVVALAASTAMHLLWSQSLWTRQVENLTARARADAVARAAAQWAVAILAEDDREVDHLGEGWARRLPPLPAENARLDGALSDEQSRFNLNNLVRNGAASPADVVALQRLLEALGLPLRLADALVDWLDADDETTEPGGAEDAHYLGLAEPYRAANRSLAHVGELARVRGFDAAAIARLAPFVTALPEPTPVNVNTASAPVLQAVVPTIAPSEARELVELRAKQPWRSRDDFLRALSKRPDVVLDTTLDVRSRFFRAEAAVAVGRVSTGYRAIVQRRDDGRCFVIGLSPFLP